MVEIFLFFWIHGRICVPPGNDVFFLQDKLPCCGKGWSKGKRTHTATKLHTTDQQAQHNASTSFDAIAFAHKSCSLS